VNTRVAVEVALAAGYRHIDTAAAYNNERQVGEALRSSGVSRSAVFVETKIWITDYGYDETLHGFDKSAGKLGVDQIDLLILHQALPSDFNFQQRGVQEYDQRHAILTQAWSPIGGITFYRDRSRPTRSASPRTSTSSTSSSRPASWPRSTRSTPTTAAVPSPRR